MLEPYQLAVAMFPNWTLAQHLQAWRKQRRGKPIEPGERFLAPDGQLFVTGGKRFFAPKPTDKLRKGKARKIVALQWHSHCRVCNAPYSFHKDARATNLIRTCPAHRGKAKRPSKLRAMILAELASAAQSADNISVIAFIDHCAALLAKPPGRDTRRQHVIRALQSLVDTGALPCILTDDSFVFTRCN